MKIDLQSAEHSYSSYASIGDFFIRRLKPGLRPIAKTLAIHPCDSRILQTGQIKKGSLIQAKGLDYELQEFVGNAQVASQLEAGQFVTYYLCPADYHRVHSPVDGVITRATHIPGYLYPVHQRSVGTRRNLYAINERVVVEIDTPQGLVVVVFVGATNVGKMSMSFDSEIITNVRTLVAPQIKTYSPGKSIRKGEELGIFHMGSTVVVLYNHAMEFNSLETLIGQKVKVGESLNQA